MLEVLVTIVILVIGLLGLAGLQVKANIFEMESYQRAQALALVRDMEARILAGRGLLDGADGFSAVASTTGDVFFGTNDDQDCSAPARAKKEACDWASALRGAAETRAGGSNVGAMLGARGCLISVQPPTDGAIAEFYVAVVWQGTSRSADPDAATPGGLCASSVNFGTGLRRAAATRVLIPKLQG